MFEYFVIVFSLMAIVVIATVVTICCCGLCRGRKQQDDEDMAEVVLYPEQPHNPYFEEHNADVDDGSRYYYSPYANGRRHPPQRFYTYRGDQQLVTAAVADSVPARGDEPYVGTIVCGPANMNVAGSTIGMREPVSYGEAVYVSRADGAAAPATQPNAAEKH
jgi:hypothetical protein